MLKNYSLYGRSSCRFRIVQRGFEDEKWAKIVLGTGMIVSGVMILALNKAPSVPNQRPNIKDRKYKVEQASSPKFLRITRVLFGLLLVGFGVYQISLGIDEFIFQRMCNQKLAKAHQAVLDCPESRKLWEMVKAKGAFTVECASSKVAPHGAVTNLMQRKIFISRKVEDVAPSLLFEINNLNRSEKALSLVYNMCFKEDYEFAKSMEALEYETAKDTYKITQACIDRNLWPEKWNIYKPIAHRIPFSQTDGWQSEEDYIKTQINTWHGFHNFNYWHIHCGILKQK